MRTLTGGYNDPVNYVDLLGLDAEAVKQVVSNPQNWEAALQAATTTYIVTRTAAAAGGGAAAAGGTAAAVGGGSGPLLPVVGGGLFAAIIIGGGVLNAMYWDIIEEEQEAAGLIKPREYPDKDVNSDLTISSPSIDDTFNSLRNQNKGPDIDKINRDIQKDAYGKDNNIGQTPEEALEELTEPAYTPEYPWEVGVKITSRQHTTSNGDVVNRKYVDNQDDLLKIADKAAGGSLDNYDAIKDNWWESPDKTRRIEWMPDGHPNTNEGPHVKICDYNPITDKYPVKEKYFINNWDNYKRSWKCENTTK